MGKYPLTWSEEILDKFTKETNLIAIQHDRALRLIEFTASNLVNTLKLSGVKSQIAGPTGSIFTLNDKGSWEGIVDTTLVRKLSESQGVPPMALNRKIGWTIFIPEEEK